MRDCGAGVRGSRVGSAVRRRRSQGSCISDRHARRAHQPLHGAAVSPADGWPRRPRVKNGPALSGYGAEAVRDAITTLRSSCADGCSQTSRAGLHGGHGARTMRCASCATIPRFRFPGLLHCTVRVFGPCRYLHSPLYHVYLLLTHRAGRDRKCHAYERGRPVSSSTAARETRSTTCPIVGADLRLGTVLREDAAAVEAFLEAGAAVPEQLRLALLGTSVRLPSRRYGV